MQVKCLATYHPGTVLAQMCLGGIVERDLRRVRQESATDTLELPVDKIEAQLSKTELLLRLSLIKERKLRVAVDIEGFVDYVSCVGFATSANEAFVVPFSDKNGASVWEEEDEIELWTAIAAVLEDPGVPKILQNFLYDAFVLAWSYGIVIRGLQDDTMLKHWELNPEWEKSLGFQTSIYTLHPYYKFERKSDDGQVQLVYCGKDCCRTYECAEAQEKALKPRQREHYRFNMELLPVLLYMELRGMRFNYEEAQRRYKATWKRAWAIQDRINREAAGSRPELKAFYSSLAGCSQEIAAFFAKAFCISNPKEKVEVEEVLWQPMRWNGKKWVKDGKRVTEHPTGAKFEPQSTQQWYKQITKRKLVSQPVAIVSYEQVRRYCRDAAKADCLRALRLVEGHDKKPGISRTLLPFERGELAELLGIGIKINATNQGGDAQWFLYEHCKLPPQYKKEGHQLSDKLASDDEAIIKAWAKSKDRRAVWCLNARRLVTATKSLRAAPDDDGRIRCSLNLVGSEKASGRTGRMSAQGSPTGSSNVNPQTWTKGMRDLFVADEGCYIYQRDLSGADGWTVAAYCAMLGDPTMLEDYYAKLKPAQILTLMMDKSAAEVNAMDRDTLRPLCKPITEENDWRYFANKRVQHGGSYFMGKNTTSSQILTDSFKKTGKPIFVSPATCEKLVKEGLFARYPGIPKYHRWLEEQLKQHGSLTASTGHTRRFHGRKDDTATIRAAASQLPQHYTTYSIKLGAHKQWHDSENRCEDGSLRVEPFLFVHDSNVGQGRLDELEFGKRKLAEWFDNKLLIAQTELVIPASGTYGPSWGEQKDKL